MSNGNPQTIFIEAPSLANNKLDDKTQREVLVYLPPSYENKGDQHYPVLYLMHGFGGTAQGWFSDDLPVHNIADQLNESGEIDEMIIVVPENGTTQTCSAYLDSPIQGNWQQFICQDLIEAIESNYRCKNGWHNRAIVGHSSGGDCVLKTLLLSPKMFKHGFAMSAPAIDASSFTFVEELYEKHFESLQQVNLGKQAIDSLDIWAHIILSNLQITFADENNPPLYCKFPLEEADFAALQANTHTTRYQAHKKQLQDVNLALDVGLKEYFLDKSRAFAQQIQADGYSVKLFEFDGGHVDHMAESMLYVLPYISDCFSE